MALGNNRIGDEVRKLVMEREKGNIIRGNILVGGGILLFYIFFYTFSLGQGTIFLSWE